MVFSMKSYSKMLFFVTDAPVLWIFSATFSCAFFVQYSKILVLLIGIYEYYHKQYALHRYSTSPTYNTHKMVGIMGFSMYLFERYLALHCFRTYMYTHSVPYHILDESYFRDKCIIPQISVPAALHSIDEIFVVPYVLKMAWSSYDKAMVMVYVCRSASIQNMV